MNLAHLPIIQVPLFVVIAVPRNRKITTAKATLIRLFPSVFAHVSDDSGPFESHEATLPSTAVFNSAHELVSCFQMEGFNVEL